jgi:hypothetical protein
MKTIKIITISLLCGLLFFACNPVKRLDSLAVQQPNEMARLANLLYPCFNGKAKSDTVYRTDSIVTPSKRDTLVTRVKDTVYKRIIIQLPGKVITRTLTIHDTVPDTRAKAALEAQATQDIQQTIKATTQLTDANKAKKTWLWIAIAEGVLIVGFLAVKIYLWFNGGSLVSGVKKLV